MNTTVENRPDKRARACVGRYPCGEETRQRIVCSAIESFGRQGYAGTSTRDIAAAAAVNTPAIAYYFGGKPGLYDACLDQLTASVARRIGPAVTACKATVANKAGLAKTIAALNDVQGALIESFFADREGQAMRRLLAWEDAEDGVPAAPRYMLDRIGMPVFQTYHAAVAYVFKGPVNPLEIEMHAVALMGLSMIFHVQQSRVMDMLEWPAPNAFLVDRLKTVAHQQLKIGLAGLARSDACQRASAPVS